MQTPLENLHFDISSHRSWHSTESQNMQESWKEVCLIWNLWQTDFMVTSLDVVTQNLNPSANGTGKCIIKVYWETSALRVCFTSAAKYSEVWGQQPALNPTSFSTSYSSLPLPCFSHRCHPSQPAWRQLCFRYMPYSSSPAKNVDREHFVQKGQYESYLQQCNSAPQFYANRILPGLAHLLYSRLRVRLGFK